MSQEFRYSDITKRITLINYVGVSKDVIIPKTIESLPVVSILTSTFRNNSIIESVTFPEYINITNHGIIFNCPNLKKITFLNEDIFIHKNAFKDCDNIEIINFFAYKHLNNIAIIKILEKKIQQWDSLSPEEVEALTYCFKRKPSVKKDIILSNNPSLISFIIKHKINIKLDDLDGYINHHIEKGNTVITSILLEYKEKNFTKQEIEKYNDNKDLVDIGLELPTLKQLKQKFSLRVERKGTEKLIYIIGHKGDETDVTIPRETSDGYIIESIENNDFKTYFPIENLTIEDGIYISSSAFRHSQLQSIVLPNTLTTIQPFTFYYSNKLKYITIPESVNSIRRYAFSYTKITSINLPRTLTCIEENTFYFCTELKSITIPEQVTRIENFAFSSCKSLEEIVFPASLEYIGDNAFKDCDNLKTATFNSKVELGCDVFNKCPNLTIIQN